MVSLVARKLINPTRSSGETVQSNSFWDSIRLLKLGRDLEISLSISVDASKTGGGWRRIE